MIAPLEERLNLTSDQLRTIFARPVAYHKLLAIAGGSVSAGVFLSQLVFWTDKGRDPDGWIYKTLDDWWEETALGRYELKTVRNALTARDLIEEKLCGVPARLHYKINWETMKVSLAKAIITHREGMSKRGSPTNKYVASPHTGEATGKNEASPLPTYRAESTTEKTTKKSGSPAPMKRSNDSSRESSSSFLFDLAKTKTEAVSDQSSADEVAIAMAEEYVFELNSGLGRKLQEYLDQENGVGYG